MARPLLFVAEDLREQLIRGGARAIKSISDAKHELDADESLQKTKFLGFLSSASVDVNQEDLASILKAYETEDNQRVRFLCFLNGLRGQPSDTREKLVVKAFNRLDKDGNGYITIHRIREVYNAKCHSAVMLEKMTANEATETFLSSSFGCLSTVTLSDFLEYYCLVGSTIKSDKHFQLMILKHWKVAADGIDIDEVENKVKLEVYKNRIRSREFMRGFDSLRLRLITENQFSSALDNSNIELTPREVQALCDNYRVPEDGEMRVCWTAFCDEIDSIFTYKELEKTPWRQPPLVPDLPGLAPQRFEHGIIYLGPEKEECVSRVLQNIKTECRRRRVSVIGFFEDAVTNRNSSKAVGHVTKQQFCQALSGKAGLRLSSQETSLLVEKFDDLRNGMVNYVAFSMEVDPFLQPDEMRSL